MKKILVVDDEPNNLHAIKQILGQHYKLLFAVNGSVALETAERHRPDLVLLDIMMPDIDGYEVCKMLKESPNTHSVPVIFLTALSQDEDEAKGFDVGAVDYIQKPISGSVVLRRVQNHLSLVHAKELEETQKEAIFMLGEAGHYNDTDTGVHIWRMASYSRAIAEAAGWEKEDAQLLELAAPMHDTGKIGIPDSILKAPRKLTSNEWEIMKQHVRIGSEILNKCNTKCFKLATEIALYHHEKWDGTGYLANLSGEAIPESARIVAIADVFDALSMKRPYKDPWPLDKAVDEIRKGAGNHFDPRLTSLFLDILPKIKELKDQWDNKEKTCLSQQI